MSVHTASLSHRYMSTCVGAHCTTKLQAHIPVHDCTYRATKLEHTAPHSYISTHVASALGIAARCVLRGRRTMRVWDDEVHVVTSSSSSAAGPGTVQEQPAAEEQPQSLWLKFVPVSRTVGRVGT